MSAHFRKLRMNVASRLPLMYLYVRKIALIKVMQYTSYCDHRAEKISQLSIDVCHHLPNTYYCFQRNRHLLTSFVVDKLLPPKKWRIFFHLTGRLFTKKSVYHLVYFSLSHDQYVHIDIV